MTVLEAVRDLATNARDIVTMPLTPTIPPRLPWMPRPHRNACWLLREMRAFYADPYRWHRGAFEDEGRYCVVGLAYHLAGNRALARQALKYVGQVTGHNGWLGLGREWNIATWNDSSNVHLVADALRRAEDLAEKAGACEP